LTALSELVRKKKLLSTRGDGNHLRRGGDFMTEREEELLNSRQVAVILDLSPDTVNEFARKNILPAFKKGKQWRFRKRDISIFYKKQGRDIRDA
jgi:excisionase family DNA binding protein